MARRPLGVHRQEVALWLAARMLSQRDQTRQDLELAPGPCAATNGPGP